MLAEVEDFSRLILIRHPELAPGHADVAVGGGEATVSRRGRERALRWVEELRAVEIDAVFCGDVAQCQEPATVLAEANALKVRPDPRLRDQGMGAWQGRKWAEIAQAEPDAVRDFFGQFGDVAAPGGEALGAAVERVLAWWAEIAPRALGQTVAVVMAGNLVSGFAAAMLGMRLSRAVCLPLPHGAMGVLDVFGNGARVATWNAGALANEGA